MAGELSKAADLTKWPRAPKLSGLGKIADHIIIADSVFAPSERSQLYKMLAEERPSWARSMCNLLDLKAPYPNPNQEVDIYAAVKANEA